VVKPKIIICGLEARRPEGYISNINRAKILLNWEPKTTPEDGIRRLV